MTGLEPATFYNFLVRARDISGLRDSNMVSPLAKTKLDDDPPFFAGVTSIVGTSATSIQVSWDAATDASPASNLTYRVYLATSSGGQNFATPSRTVVGVLSASFTGLARNTPYYAVVQVSDPDENLNESLVEASGATRPDTTAPILASAPTVNAASETSIGVSWTAATDDSYPANQLSYQVQYRAQGAGGFANWGGLVSGAGTLSTTITGLEVGTTYQVRIIPRDGVPNVGTASPIGSATTSNDTDPPTFNVTPTLSGETSGNYNEMTLSWSAASDNVSSAGNIFYEVCYSTTSTGCNAFTAYRTTTPGTTNSVIFGFLWGTRYYFRVRAVDEAGNRTMGNVVTDSTLPATFAAPSLTASANNITVKSDGTSDAVFTNLRYQMVHYAGAWNGSTCSYSWTNGPLGAAIAKPPILAILGSVDRLFGANLVRILATDGFGNQRYSSSYGSLTDSTAGAASAVIQPLWDANCRGSGCHGGTGGSYLAWNMTTAFQSPSPVGGFGAVIVKNSLNSRMYLRTTGQSGSLMPSGASVPVDDLVCNLQRWIQAGAPH